MLTKNPAAMDGSFFSALLSVLGVKHTPGYSDARFASMPFRTLFGLTGLLKEYGVGSTGVRLNDKSQISLLTPPFVVPVDHSVVIVTDMSGGDITYQSVRTAETMPVSDFVKAWDGTALLLSADADSAEPGYSSHVLAGVMTRLRNWGMWLAAAVILIWLLVSGDFFTRPSLLLTALFDIGGLALSFLLVQKTLGIHTAAGEKVCNVLAPGGCDTISRSDASSFLGIFHWSEVGLVYFGVSLLALLAFPSTAPWLAWINVLALPYTVWSISYQYFKAHTWCTMCVGVQITLWVTFLCYLCGGWLSPDIFVWRPQIILLLLAYGLAMTVTNRLDAFFTPAVAALNDKQS